MEVGDRAIAAARRLLARCAATEFFSLLTIEALRNEMLVDGLGAVPSTRRIAQAFSRGDAVAGFDRTLLVESILAQTLEELVEVARSNAEGYVQAADTIRRGGGPEALVSAMSRDIQDYQPTGSSGPINERERVFHLCVAMCDDEPALARELKRFLQTHRDIYEPVYNTWLNVFNRRLATNVTMVQLHVAVNAYLRGTHVYVRSGWQIGDEALAATVLRIFWAHTAPVVGNEHDPVAELWGGRDVRSPRPPTHAMT